MIAEFPGDLLQWLRGFYFVALKGSVTQATEMMRRVQPTISRQIKCLEQDLGVKLFDRSSGKMELTPEGKVILQKAISLFEEIEGMRREFSDKNREYEGNIAIAASHTIIDVFLSPYIDKFRKEYPLVTFHLEGGVFGTVVEKIISSQVDFGIAFVSSIPEMIECHNLFETEILLIAPKNNSFFYDKIPTLREIARAPLIFCKITETILPVVEEVFSQAGLQPNIVITHNNSISVKKYVSLGLGVSLISGYAVSEADKSSLDIISLDPCFPKMKYGLLLRKKKYLSPSAKAFIRTIKPDIRIK